MAEFASLTHLLAKLTQGLGVEAFLQDLDRKGLPGDLLIDYEVYDSHATRTELALDAVAAGEPLADRKPFMGGRTVRCRCASRAPTAATRDLSIA
jgi:hypothetical protein